MVFVFPGINSNIKHRNQTYHIQTEVNTVNDENKINTIIYLSGTILTSISSKLEKEDSLNRETAVRAVKKQHNKLIRDLISDQLETQKKEAAKQTLDFNEMYSHNKELSIKGISNPFEAYKSLLLYDDTENGEKP